MLHGLNVRLFRILRTPYANYRVSTRRVEAVQVTVVLQRVDAGPVIFFDLISDHIGDGHLFPRRVMATSTSLTVMDRHPHHSSIISTHSRISAVTTDVLGRSNHGVDNAISCEIRELGTSLCRLPRASQMARREPSGSLAQDCAHSPVLLFLSRRPI